MNAKPVSRWRRPGYPTKLEVLAHPELLESHLPPAWSRRADIAAAVALLLAANGCTKDRPVGSPESGARRQPAIAAPVFEHGEGRGVTGCVVVAAPVFLSEEEALQVVTEQLRYAGIEVAGTNVEMTSVRVEQAMRRGVNARRAQGAGTIKPLEVDGLIGDGTMAFEFVSESDYFNFGGLRSPSTVQSYNLKTVAESLARRVADRGENVYFGTFYDPVQAIDLSTEMRRDNPEKWWREKTTTAKEESKRLLRAQVADFVNWLKAQGAI